MFKRFLDWVFGIDRSSTVVYLPAKDRMRYYGRHSTEAADIRLPAHPGYLHPKDREMRDPQLIDNYRPIGRSAETARDDVRRWVRLQELRWRRDRRAEIRRASSFLTESFEELRDLWPQRFANAGV